MSNHLTLNRIRDLIPVSRAKTGTPAPGGQFPELYELLESYYHNNGLYERLAMILGNAGQREGVAAAIRRGGSGATVGEVLAALRTPARRVVEFYAGTIWPGTLPGALPLVTDNQRIVEPIEKIWLWSNWASKKQLAIRRMAIFGDLVLKVSRRDRVYVDPADPEAAEILEPSSVFVEVINPKHIPDGGLILDERGNVIYIRIDVPKTRPNEAGLLKEFTHTEIWTRQRFRRYEHDQGFNADLSKVGQPKDDIGIEEFGIDFVPFVYASFSPIDELARGIGAYTLALDKINELNRMATRLHDLLFRYNKAVWALRSNMVDAAGRPIIVDIEGDTAGSSKVTLEDDDLLKLPGNADIAALVPTLDYGNYLAAIVAQAQELESDLPELAYSRLREKGELSGRAITLLLGDAIARAIEVRGAAETALIKAHKMALTMGAAAGLFKDIGTYDNGDFDHSFVERPIIRSTELDKAEIVKAYRETGLALETALARAGWSRDDIDEALAAVAKERSADQEALAAATLEAARRMDSGAASNGMERPDPAAPSEEPAEEPAAP
jgi:hypothetical protein